MPSSREILLARHRAVEPRLDVLRATALADAGRPGDGPSPLNALRLLWRELVAPCRPAWMTLAAVWAVLLLFNGAGRSTADASRFATQETVAAFSWWLERRRVLAELAAPAAAPAASIPADIDIPGHSQVSPAASGRDVC